MAVVVAVTAGEAVEVVWAVETGGVGVVEWEGVIDMVVAVVVVEVVDGQMTTAVVHNQMALVVVTSKVMEVVQLEAPVVMVEAGLHRMRIEAPEVVAVVDMVPVVVAAGIKCYGTSILPVQVSPISDTSLKVAEAVRCRRQAKSEHRRGRQAG